MFPSCAGRLPSRGLQDSSARHPRSG
jgi:hypothetical protein